MSILKLIAAMRRRQAAVQAAAPLPCDDPTPDEVEVIETDGPAEPIDCLPGCPCMVRAASMLADADAELDDEQAARIWDKVSRPGGSGSRCTASRRAVGRSRCSGFLRRLRRAQRGRRTRGLGRRRAGVGRRPARVRQGAVLLRDDQQPAVRVLRERGVPAMVTWFLNLPIEQRAWVLLGAGLVLLGLAVAGFTWAENRFQRRQDRANVPAETVVLPRVDTAALRRHLVRYGDDTEGGGSR